MCWGYHRTLHQDGLLACKAVAWPPLQPFCFSFSSLPPWGALHQDAQSSEEDSCLASPWPPTEAGLKVRMLPPPWDVSTSHIMKGFWLLSKASFAFPKMIIFFFLESVARVFQNLGIGNTRSIMMQPPSPGAAGLKFPIFGWGYLCLSSGDTGLQFSFLVMSVCFCIKAILALKDEFGTSPTSLLFCESVWNQHYFRKCYVSGTLQWSHSGLECSWWERI